MDQRTQWQAVLTRDASRDGQFVYGVTTTGIYCRPSCPARKPNPDNVRFFASAAEAERHGLRACKRCHPREDPAGDTPDWIASACRYIEAHCDEPLSLAQLAHQFGVPARQLQRRFRAALGITPRAYAEACRLGTLKQRLRTAPSVTDAIYDAGFGSTSRVYERASTHMGMTPRQYRDGGAGLQITHAGFDSPLGPLLMAATDRGLCFVQFGNSQDELRDRLASEFPQAERTAMDPAHAAGPFADWMAALSDYLQGRPVALDLPTDVRGTAFQCQVWDYLRTIPRGELRTYKDIATALGRPRATRAVGRAIASNRVGLVIPCHRVIRANGELGGYRWGTERKQALLERERGDGTS
jgi:AraC family transcriptional regulator of adaptative response/methylated-DNA-[protein]-cysteine methyltransferase